MGEVDDTRRRRLRGTPSGGEFAPEQRAEADVALEPFVLRDDDLGDGWAVLFEHHMWTPTSPHGHRLSAMIEREYAAAVPARIAERDVELDADARVQASEVAIEIARFDAEIGERFAPFDALLLRSESSASSQIENLTAGAKALLMAEAGDDSRHNATLIASNTAAMRAAVDLADQPSEEAIIEMHRALLERSAPDIVGSWRDEQVWIGGRGHSPHGAMFVPPHHKRVPEAMADLVAFMKRTDVEPFPQAIIAHAQFETVHPFSDGNGRTGRALIHSHLRHARLTRNVTVPISAGLMETVDRYFDALGGYRQGNLSPIVSLASEAAHRAMANGRRLAADVDEVRSQWAERTNAIRSDSVVHRVVADLPAQPVVDAAAIQQTYGVGSRPAYRAIDQLVEAGVLSQAKGGLRFRKHIAHDIADALDAFAERAGRRSLG